MNTINRFYNKFYNPSLGLLLLRIMIGIIFLYHGVMKLSDMGSTVGFFASIGVGAFFAWVVALIETLGGIAMIIGFMSRVAGKLLAITMIFAIFLVKMKSGFPGMELDLILLAGNLAIMFAGSGRYAVDQIMMKKCSCTDCGADGCTCTTEEGTCGCDCGCDC